MSVVCFRSSNKNITYFQGTSASAMYSFNAVAFRPLFSSKIPCILNSVIELCTKFGSSIYGVVWEVVYRFLVQFWSITTIVDRGSNVKTTNGPVYSLIRLFTILSLQVWKESPYARTWLGVEDALFLIECLIFLAEISWATNFLARSAACAVYSA